MADANKKTRRDLEMAIEAAALNQSKAAEMLGIARQTLNAIINGHRSPTLPQAVAIEELFDIAPRCWT